MTDRNMWSPALCAAIALFAAPAFARRDPPPVWQVSRTTDPISGASSCVVHVPDRAAGLSFTRAGALYPLVENSSRHGLLVGVSSGGRYRVPVGDIEWRVDDRPARLLKAADNPIEIHGEARAGSGDGDDASAADSMAKMMQLTAALTATSTMASGQIAQDIIAEMLAGRSLIYRSANIQTRTACPMLRGMWSDGSRKMVWYHTPSMHRSGPAWKHAGFRPEHKLANWITSVLRPNPGRSADRKLILKAAVRSAIFDRQGWWKPARPLSVV